VSIFVAIMLALCVITTGLIILAWADERWREIRQEPDRPYQPLHSRAAMDKKTVKIGPEQRQRAVQE
jgi:hypothetical protein